MAERILLLLLLSDISDKCRYSSTEKDKLAYHNIQKKDTLTKMASEQDIAYVYLTCDVLHVSMNLAFEYHMIDDSMFPVPDELIFLSLDISNHYRRFQHCELAEQRQDLEKLKKFRAYTVYLVVLLLSKKLEHSAYKKMIREVMRSLHFYSYSQIVFLKTTLSMNGYNHLASEIVSEEEEVVEDFAELVHLCEQVDLFNEMTVTCDSCGRAGARLPCLTCQKFCYCNEACRRRGITRSTLHTKMCALLSEQIVEDVESLLGAY